MDKTATAPLKWPEYQVIEAEDGLKKKALVPGSKKDAIAEATKKAEAAVDMLSAQFPMWMQTESQKLSAVRNEIAAKGFSDERLDRFFTCAHDIKGQAHTFGYPIAGIISKLLCALIEQAAQPSKIPLAVMDQHVYAISAIVRENIKGDGTDQARNIVNGLNVLNQSTLKKINREHSKALAS